MSQSKRNNFDRLPTENKAEVANLSYDPQTIVIQGCDVTGLTRPLGMMDYEESIREGSEYILELLLPYKSTPLLNVNRQMRAIAEQRYKRILQSAIPEHGIFWDHQEKALRAKYKDDNEPVILLNFEIDTLAFRPNRISHETTLIEETGVKRTIKLARPESTYPFHSLEMLRDLLRVPENNLKELKNIAIGDFKWAKRDPNNLDDEGLRYETDFNKQIENGFQNLENLFLIYNETRDPNDGDTEYYKLDTPDDQKKFK
jgi:hypothetical protein